MKNSTQNAALTCIGEGIMPFGGGMRFALPYALATAAKLIPQKDWSSVTINDMTCGSCAIATAFRFYGMLANVNDISLRSYVAAKAIFGAHTSKHSTVTRLVELARNPVAVPEGKHTAASLVSSYVHPIACRVFDSFYYAAERGDIPEAEGHYYRYIALRFILLQKPFMYFLKLPTHDLVQLEIQSDAWKKVVANLRDPLATILGITKKVDALVSSLDRNRDGGARVFRGDCREIAKQIDYGTMSLTNLNPPTMGNGFFMSSNKIPDTLLFSEAQSTKDTETPADLWRTIIQVAGSQVPSGHYILSFCGDGNLTLDEGRAEWSKLGEIVAEERLKWRNKEKTAGLVFIRRS